MGVKFDPFSYKVMDDYIHFIFKGERTSDIGYNWWKVVAEITKKLGFKKILVEAIIFNELSFQEIRDAVSELEQLDFKEIKIAYVENNLNHKSMNQMGVEMVKIIADIDAKIFKNKEEAIAWLKLTTKPKK